MSTEKIKGKELNKAYPAGRLQETRRQGTFGFPCTMYFADAAQNLPEEENRQNTPPLYDLSFEVKPHWHEAIEIIHIEKGTFQVNINMEQFTVEKEAFVFVESGMIHSMFCEKDYLEQALLLEPSILAGNGTDTAVKEIIDPLVQGRLHFPVLLFKDEPGFAPVAEEFARISACFIKSGETVDDQHILTGTSGMLRVKGALLNMMAGLKEASLISGGEYDADPRAEALKKVIVYIREHYEEKISLKDLASIMNMNEQYFCRFFRKTMRRTPVTYLNEVRIRQAVQLLEQTNLQVVEIAGECGFGNMGHFITEFRKMTGVTPLAYRKNSR